MAADARHIKTSSCVATTLLLISELGANGDTWTLHYEEVFKNRAQCSRAHART